MFRLNVVKETKEEAELFYNALTQSVEGVVGLGEENGVKVCPLVKHTNDDKYETAIQIGEEYAPLDLEIFINDNAGYDQLISLNGETAEEEE
jgi:hypothetical protein